MVSAWFALHKLRPTTVSPGLETKTDAPPRLRCSTIWVMEFDRYTISLLMLRSDAPAFSEQEEAELQDAHMSHLARLHQAGHCLPPVRCWAHLTVSSAGFRFSTSIRRGRGNSKKRIPPSARVSTASRCIPGCFRQALSLSQLGAFRDRWLKLRPTDPGRLRDCGMRNPLSGFHFPLG